MAKIVIQPPVVQVAIDVLNMDDALRIAEAAVRAGVDWLEAGTPLITFAGTPCIGALARAFPGVPILADYKAMDGVRKYVMETRKQGGHLATVCAQAADASVQVAIQAGRDTDIAIVSDLIAVPDVPARAVELEAMGIDSVYVHWGADQRALDPARDSQADLAAVVERVRIPVGVGTFSVEDGVRAVRQGAQIVAIGVPLIQADDVEAALREYVARVKETWSR